MKLKFSPTKNLIAAVICLFVFSMAAPILGSHKVGAAQLTSRSLSLSSSANGSISTDAGGNAVAAGAGGNGLKAKHTFTFTLATTGNVGSISLIYCNSPVFAVSCTAPTGSTNANVTSIQTQTGFSTNNFTYDTTTANASVTGCTGSGTTRINCLLIKRASAASENSGAAITLAFGGQTSDYITNPTGDNTSFYVRITTYSATNYTTAVDTGAVAASTAQQVDITAKVQEVLNFSVGTTVTAPGASCTAFSDTGALTLGDSNGVLSSSQAYDAHSYFRVNTNTANGTKIYYSGDTLKSGANSITAIGTTATSSAVGTSQFGLGLDSSDTQGGSGYSFTQLSATSPYNQGNGTITNGGTAKFAFDTATTTTPAQMASSSQGVTCDTGSVRYIGNISTSQPSGIYTTTITYIATGTY